ncbi:MAG: formylglycine-generating enzyme family protein [Rhizomicrobium sp.]
MASRLIRGIFRGAHAMRVAKLTIIIGAVLTLGAARADWLSVRQDEFAAWQKAHPNVDAEIAALKVKSERLVARHPMKNAESPPVIFRVRGAITELWDAPEAPRMIVIPAGEYTMGSPGTEPGRNANEGPQHRVRITYPLAVSTFIITRDEFAAFAVDTKRPDPETGKVLDPTGKWNDVKGASWHNPGFPQTGTDPASYLGWQDAQDYVVWLSRKTGKTYRLLSEAEWEYAARAGTTTARYWGDDISRDNANYGADHTYLPFAQGRDRWLYTSPAGSFPPNAFGLYDMLGNGWERLEDCWNPDYIGAPTDGSPRLTGDCDLRAGRGGSWATPPSDVRVAFRGRDGKSNHYANGVFRVARQL